MKIRGNRVEPGEIEAVLQTHPDVTHAVVLAEDGRLTAFVTPGPGSSQASGASGSSEASGASGASRADAVALRRHLAESLPAYMIPSRITRVDAMPLTGTGKIDRRALAALGEAPPPSPSRTAAARTAPRTPTEIRLAAVWSALLQADEVCREDDFFVLGGDSCSFWRCSPGWRSRAARSPGPPSSTATARSRPSPPPWTRRRRSRRHRRHRRRRYGRRHRGARSLPAHPHPAGLPAGRSHRTGHNVVLAHPVPPARPPRHRPLPERGGHARRAPSDAAHGLPRRRAPGRPAGAAALAAPAGRLRDPHRPGAGGGTRHSRAGASFRTLGLAAAAAAGAHTSSRRTRPGGARPTTSSATATAPRCWYGS